MIAALSMLVGSLLCMAVLLYAKMAELRSGTSLLTAFVASGDHLLAYLFKQSSRSAAHMRTHAAHRGLAALARGCKEAYAYCTWLLESRPIRMARAMPERGIAATREKVSKYLRDVSAAKENGMSGNGKNRIDS